MIIKEDYKSKLEVIKAISVDRIKDPKHIPVDIYILTHYPECTAVLYRLELNRVVQARGFICLENITKAITKPINSNGGKHGR